MEEGEQNDSVIMAFLEDTYTSYCFLSLYFCIDVSLLNFFLSKTKKINDNFQFEVSSDYVDLSCLQIHWSLYNIRLVFMGLHPI